MVPKLSETPGCIRRTGPELGADTDRVLREELGYPEERIRELRLHGVVHGGANE